MNRHCRRIPWRSLRNAWLTLVGISHVALAADAPHYAEDVQPLLKARCVKCHGPAKAEAGLNLSTAAQAARGGEQGSIVLPHDPDGSLLWQRVNADEMPPKEPLSVAEKDLLRRWILAGAPGMPAKSAASGDAREHWAFQPLVRPELPRVEHADQVSNPIDQFVQAELEAVGLELAPAANRNTLIRRVALLLTGLPPTAGEVRAFVDDPAPDAYERMVERYLASPRYGERWGKFWLDAAGYADSNGYFNADSDRPLAHRYRDYVIRAVNENRPFDQFIREQLAGDEAAGYQPGQAATPRTAELLVATHYLRNGQDGTSESDGNQEELRIDRYSALEACMQNVVASLLALTIQCAKCHDHKFEPISQADYYRWQAIFYPVFPAAHEQHWIKPKDRILFAPGPGEQEAWESEVRLAEKQAAELRADLNDWVREHRPSGELLFEDDFAAAPLASQWSNTPPTDDLLPDQVAVQLDATVAPAAAIDGGRLQLIESGGAGDRCISTRQSFDWSPDDVGASILATFDLVDARLTPDGEPAARIGYLIALHDFNDNGPNGGGNVLIDGNPGGATTIYVDYPGPDTTGSRTIGATGFTAGHNYGVRITNAGEGQFQLELLVDDVPDGSPATLSADELPPGAFGFEYCCGRSFVVDNVRIERFPPPADDPDPARAEFRAQLDQRRMRLDEATARHAELAGARPGAGAWASDAAAEPLETHLLPRGDYGQPADVVPPRPLSVLMVDADDRLFAPVTGDGIASAQRLALANWLTRPQSRPAALIARVQVNRIWEHYFGAGIVATSDNLGLSGAAPSHPALLDWLADEFVASGWRLKHVHRLILDSATFRQLGTLPEQVERRAAAVDPANRLLWRFQVQRLDAESIRDAILAVSGQLNARMGGPYDPTQRAATGEVLTAADPTGTERRSIYLQQRRTQVHSLLQVFDSPSIVFNSIRRPRTTIPLQALTLLNSPFVVTCAESFAARLEQQSADESPRLSQVYEAVFARTPDAAEQRGAIDFLDAQTAAYGDRPDARHRAWVDLCQALLASNEFLYVE